MLTFVYCGSCTILHDDLVGLDFLLHSYLFMYCNEGEDEMATITKFNSL